MKPLYIAFVWHQHQPNYKNPQTNKYLLPWVRLHCTKDYYDIAAILEKFPKIKQTINITPCLMEQIVDYTKGATDDFLDVTKKITKELTADERIFILKNFFMANPETMIEPYPRYNELFQRRGWRADDNYLKRIEPLFSTADIRDLVVWFNLSWVGPYFRQHNEKIKCLLKKEKNFSEEDKQTLIDEATKIILQVLLKHKELQDKGQIEITTSPYYHPILPLLIDTNIAKVGMPNVTLPKIRFHQPDDAEHQIKAGAELYEKIFGRKSRGMWPSEGSVSSDIVPLVAKNGINWIATDEEILFQSLGEINICNRNEILYKPYKISVGKHSVNVIFRDHKLSDLIGFVYHKMNAEDAANDFIGRLTEIKNSISNNNGAPALASIILDGENCWEYYKNSGFDFLNSLYTKLSNESNGGKNGLITTTVSEYLSKFPPKNELKGIFPGSWINGDFGIWIGHPEDNQAWNFLNQTRKFLLSRTPKTKPPENIKKAWEEIYIAEGSDWNWWYGADHSSMNDAEFDQLFRAHLIHIYKLLNEKVPDELYFSIKRKWEILGNITNPVDFIKPKIDGKITSYFEWHNAGFYDVSKSGGAMHQTDTCIKMIYWGFDETELYFRLDSIQPFPKNIKFKIVFLKPAQQKDITIDPDDNSAVFDTTELKNIVIGKGGIIELSLPFSKIGTKPGETIEFVVLTEQKGLELERWPYHASIILAHPSKNFPEEHWSV
ncbi:MAG: glycoside hydrolase [Elusimicrobia bacterium CG06_land_8_20_14_3_00_38_11]|nr:MAG: glycoside hydrolase [Elusimicrobia bacterium CG06_land_8_20_14_3_00_38_11]